MSSDFAEEVNEVESYGGRYPNVNFGPLHKCAQICTYTCICIHTHGAGEHIVELNCQIDFKNYCKRAVITQLSIDVGLDN